MSRSSYLSWNRHYTANKSLLSFPDENLVRMLSMDSLDGIRKDQLALDLGCGSGRHLPLLESFGYNVTGSDLSENALNRCSSFSDALVVAENSKLPFHESVFDAVCAWGSLHYCMRKESEKQINEIYRILKPGGILYGTLRSEDDTFFERIEEKESSWSCSTTSLSTITVTFYDEKELSFVFSSFGSLLYGHTSRTQLGGKGRISHWFFRAEK